MSIVYCFASIAPNLLSRTILERHHPHVFLPFVDALIGLTRSDLARRHRTVNPLRGPPIESSILQIVREASLVYCLPNNPFFTPATGNAAQEAAYASVSYLPSKLILTSKQLLRLDLLPTLP